MSVSNFGYYEFFNDNGWDFNKEDNDSVKIFCSRLESSTDQKTRKKANDLLEVLEYEPKEVSSILMGNRIENLRRDYLKETGKSFVKNLFNSNTITSTHEEEVLKIITNLINSKDIKNKTFIKENAKFFVDFLFPHKKINIEEFSCLILALSDLPLQKQKRFFLYADTEKNKARIVEMVKTIKDFSNLSLALSSIARQEKLQIYQFTDSPEYKHWDIPGLGAMRELPLIRKSVFLDGSYWGRSAFNPIYISENRYISDREVGLMINESYLKNLRKIGGKEFFLQNPDEEKIHCMTFCSEIFAEKMASEIEKLNLLMKVTKKNSDQCIHIFKKPEGNDSNTLAVLIEMGALSEMSRKTLKKELDDFEIDEKKLNEIEKGLYLVMYPSLAESKREDKNEKPVTAVLCAGTGVWFSLYNPMICRLLMNGMDVLAFSYRGYELSEGIPTDKKIFQDLETVCHHLFDTKMIEEEQLLLYASCLGLGPAAQYVKNHPQTNLIIDRSFANLSTVAYSKIQEMTLPLGPITKPVAGTIARIAMPFFVNFENLSHLKNARGDIAIITSEDDNFIKKETEELRREMPDAYHITSPAKYGHEKNWLRDSKMVEEFEIYLLEKGLSRQLQLDL